MTDRSAGLDEAELLARADTDPWLRWAVERPLPHHRLVHDGVLLVQPASPRASLWVVPLRADATGAGAPDEAARVLAAVERARATGLLQEWRTRAVSLPAEHAAAAAPLLPLSPRGGDWEWMWTTEVPDPVPGEEALELLDDRADGAELTAFAHAHNPRVWTRIGEGTVERWVGLRDPDGQLVAVGGAELGAAGVPLLVGILTATPARGRGLGRLITAALTRWSVREYGVSTLGVYSDNDVAIALYRSLGYATARRWCSRELLGAGGEETKP